MSQNDERDAFEAWCTDCNEEISFERLPVRKGSTCDWYRDKEVEAMWLAWQARAALANQRAEVPPGFRAENGDTLWLWKNGDHYLAFKHLYPCFEPAGDPMTLGQPFGRAEFRASHDRALAAAPQPQQASSEQQSYRDADDVPTERAVLVREWKAMRLALATPRPAQQPRQMVALTEAARDVLAERQRQISAEGWTTAHDDAEHENGELAIAAACYALIAERGLQVATLQIPKLWEWTGWRIEGFKPRDKRRNLVKAGALILAEIERLDRASGIPAPGGKE